MARTPASDGSAGVGKSGSPAPRSITSSPAALRRFASCEIAIVAEVSRWCRLGERPDPGVMGERIARTGKGTQPEPTRRCLPLRRALPSLPSDRPLTTEDRVTVADAKAALERGRPVVLVRPPAVEHARDLWELLGPLAPAHGPGVGPRVLVLCADDASAAEWVAAAPVDRPVHAVTGLARTGRVLKERPVEILAGAAKDIAALLERAALKLAAVAGVVLAWPEALVDGDGAAAVDTVLGEARDAHRIVLSWNPALLGDLLERHARRALVLGTAPVDETGRPLPPVCRARFAVVPSLRRPLAVRDALDALSATTPFVWNGGPIAPSEAPPDAVLCTALPSREELAALARLGGGRSEPVVFIAAGQLSYLRSVATLTPLALACGADRARERQGSRRSRDSRSRCGERRHRPDRSAGNLQRCGSRGRGGRPGRAGAHRDDDPRATRGRAARPGALKRRNARERPTVQCPCRPRPLACNHSCSPATTVSLRAAASRSTSSTVSIACAAQSRDSGHGGGWRSSRC